MNKNLEGNLNPVSYTHLDVYKRQTMNSSINVKVDVQNSKFDEQNSKFDEMDTQNVKFEINMNKHLNEIDTHLNTVKEQIL